MANYFRLYHDISGETSPFVKVKNLKDANAIGDCIEQFLGRDAYTVQIFSEKEYRMEVANAQIQD